MSSIFNEIFYNLIILVFFGLLARAINVEKRMGKPSNYWFMKIFIVALLCLISFPLAYVNHLTGVFMATSWAYVLVMVILKSRMGIKESLFFRNFYFFPSCILGFLSVLPDYERGLYFTLVLVVGVMSLKGTEHPLKVAR